MKNILSKFLLLSVMTTLLFSACKKDDKNKATYVKSDATLTLMASATAVELSETVNGEEVINFTWEKPYFSYNAEVTYSLEFDVPSDSFANPEPFPVGVDIYNQSFKGAVINQIATKLKMVADTVNIMQIRLVAEVKQNNGGGANSPTIIEPMYSIPIEVKVIPYSSEIVYPSIYAVGAFQGWKPEEGIQLYSFNSDNNYEGYIDMTGTSGGDLEFKFTSQPDWAGTNYGSGGAPTTTGFITTGTLSTDGGAGNLKVPESGYYRIKANTDGLTWEAYQTTWGLIGSATPGGWDNSTVMTYDAPSRTWILESIALTSGEIKFRANNAWDLSYGSDVTGTKLTSDNGSNITVSEAGNYKVVLDLSNSTNYNYKLTKL